MLQAVLHGKAGTLTIKDNEQAISWRSLFKAREDLLTASLFTRISYFPSIWMNIFFTSLFEEDRQLGELIKLHFWPRFELEQQTVEPDLLFSFQNKDILIEVKPPAGGKQHSTQWCREIDSFLQQRETKTEIDRELIFIALGNNDPLYQKWSEILKLSRNNLSIYCLEWKQILTAIMKVQQIVGSNPLIDDCLAALTLYGILQPVPQWRTLQQLIVKDFLSENNLSDFYILPTATEIPNVIPSPCWKSLTELVSNHSLSIKE